MLEMMACDLDRSIIIQRATSAPNEFNEPVETWANFIKVRAQRRDVSDGEQNAAGLVGSFVSARFIIRSSADARTVTPIDRIVHEGKTWSIHGVKEASVSHSANRSSNAISKDQGRRQFIEITAVKDADG